VSTIDAFCLSLLREFPLEADVDPGFDLADTTEVPRLIGSRSIRRFASAAASLATMTMSRWCSRNSASGGCAAAWRPWLDRRLVAPHALRRFLQKGRAT